MTYLVYWNPILNCFEELTNKDLSDMNLKHAKDRLKYEREHRKNCILCGKDFKEWGNDPWPLASMGWCCDRCNATKVIPARIRNL